MSVQEFLKKVEKKAIEKSKQMARLELSVWDENHERALIKEFGFTKQGVSLRKKELKKQAA